MLIKPDFFDKYTWWLHKKTATKFVVVDLWKLDDGFEIGVLEENKSSINWRKEQYLIDLKNKGDIKEII